MTEFTQQQTEQKVIPFLKFGTFDTDNYRSMKDAKKAQETEAKYGTVRIEAGQKVSGVITGIHPSINGEVLYLKEVVGAGDLERVKIPLTTDLSFKVKTQGKKKAGDLITIEYLGKLPSPKNESRSLHKFNVE